MKVPWDEAMRGLAQWVAAGTGLPNGKIVWLLQGGPWPQSPWASLSLGATRGVGTDWTRLDHNQLDVAALVDGVDDVSDELLILAHELQTGDGPIRVASTGAVPGGLDASTDYWVVVSGPDEVSLAASRADAIAGVPVLVDITDAGSGVISIASTAETRRVGEEIVHIVEGMRSATLTVQVYTDEVFGTARAQAMLERLRSSLALPTQQQRMSDIGFAVATFGDVVVVGGTDPRAVADIRLNYFATISEAGTDIRTVEVTAEVDGLPGIAFQATIE